MSATPSPTSTCSELWAEQSLVPAKPTTRCSKCAKYGNERGMKRCHDCKLVIYCVSCVCKAVWRNVKLTYVWNDKSPKCQRAHQELHRSICKPTPHLSPVTQVAWGLKFTDKKFGSYSDLELTICASTHKTQQFGWLCKATECIGVPIWLAPANLEEPEYSASKDLTSICHYLMMDPETGFASDE